MREGGYLRVIPTESLAPYYKTADAVPKTDGQASERENERVERREIFGRLNKKTTIMGQGGGEMAGARRHGMKKIEQREKTGSLW